MSSKKMFSKILAKSLLIPTVVSCFGCNFVSSTEDNSSGIVQREFISDANVKIARKKIAIIHRYIVERVIDKKLSEKGIDRKSSKLLGQDIGRFVIDGAFVNDILNLLGNIISDMSSCDAMQLRSDFSHCLPTEYEFNLYIKELLPRAWWFLKYSEDEYSKNKYNENTRKAFENTRKALQSFADDYRKSGYYNPGLYESALEVITECIRKVNPKLTDRVSFENSKQQIVKCIDDAAMESKGSLDHLKFELACVLIDSYNGYKIFQKCLK